MRHPLALRFNKALMPANAKASVIFFVGLALFYLSLSPGALLGMGYTGENVNASNQIISNLSDWLHFRLATTSITWPRHGLFELIFEIPFLLISKLFWGDSPVWADRMLAFQPVLATSALCTLIFIWIRRITSNAAWGYALAMVAAFSTMLWPYAYIGLETTQSLFLLLSGFMALGSDRKKTWLNAFVFALAAGLAVSLKSNSILLAPAVVFAIGAYIRDLQEASRTATSDGGKAVTGKSVMIALIVISMYIVNGYTRSLSKTWSSGTLNVFKTLNVDSYMTVIFNVISLFGSPNKGLLIYCPVVILSLLGIPLAYRRNQRVTIFSLLTLFGLAGCALFYFYTDETWGPRYLHTAIAHLVVSFALTRETVRLQFRREIILLTLVLLGTAVSFLGAFYYYGNLQRAATQAGQATIENFQADPNWNHIRFNLMLLQTWSAKGSDPVMWTPTRHWWFEQPPNAAPPKSLNLQDYAMPQSSLVRGWFLEKTGSYLIVWWCYLICIIAGVLLLAWLGFRLRRQPAADRPVAGGVVNVTQALLSKQAGP
jgi:hypothetical protein